MEVSVHEEPPKGGTTNGPAMVIIRKDNMDNYSDALLEDSETAKQLRAPSPKLGAGPILR